MDNPRPEKVAVVDEVRERLSGSTASVVTEYRGLTVAQLAELRRNLRGAGADYKIFKNTLVRRAIDGSPYAPLEELLTGPTAITFVQGDVSAVAKALREFSRAHAQLIVKGGLLDGSVLSASQLGALADLPSRDVLLARVAGAIAAPMTQLAGLIQALPRNLAYGLKALIDQKGGVPASETPPVSDAAEPADAGQAEEAPAPEVTAEAAAGDVPEAEPASGATAQDAEVVPEGAEGTAAGDAGAATEEAAGATGAETAGEEAEPAQTAADEPAQTIADEPAETIADEPAQPAADEPTDAPQAAAGDGADPA